MLTRKRLTCTTTPEVSADDQDRAHVCQDIMPYTCFVEECKTPEEMYLTSETLLAHLIENHSIMRWVCNLCAQNEANPSQFASPREFWNAEVWGQHVEEEHGDRVAPSQRPIFAELSRQAVIGPLACPLCEFATAATSSSIDEHILQHLHEFSLWALPVTSETASDERSRVSQSIGTLLHTKSTIKETKQPLEYDALQARDIISIMGHLLRLGGIPSLNEFVDWIQEFRWPPPDKAEEAFWECQFSKVQSVIAACDENEQDTSLDFTPVMLEELVRENFDDLLTWRSERNPQWTCEKKLGEALLRL